MILMIILGCTTVIKYFKYIILLVLLLFISVPAYSATYTVCAADEPTCDFGDIGEVNAVDFADGDIIQFNKGETFDDAIITFAAITNPTTKTITIQAYGAGTLPWLGGTAHRSIYINNNNQDGLSLVLKDLRFDSQEGEGSYTGDSWPKIYLVDLENITIDNVNGDGSVDWVSDQKRALQINNSTGNVEIKNCTIQYWGGDDSLWAGSPTPTYTGRDASGIGVITKNTGTLSIHDNTVIGVESDCIIMEHVNTTSTVIYNNYLWNGGENSVDNKDSSNVEVYNNTMGRDPSFIGVGGSSTGETNNHQGLVQTINMPQGASHDVSIHDNLLGPTDLTTYRFERAGNSTTLYNLSFYNNYCKAAYFQLYTAGSCQDVKIYNNIFNGIVSGGQFIFDYEVNNVNGNLYYNNTFYNNSSVATPLWPGMVSILTSNASFINNIFYTNDPNDVIVYVRSDSNPTINHNAYFNVNVGDDDIISYKDTTYDEGEQATWITAGHTGVVFGDPTFTNPATPDFSLQSGSPCIDTGDTLNQAYDDGWNSNTALPENGVSVTTSDQDTAGVGWEIGAYVFTGAEDPPQPTITDTTETPLTCPNGQNPLDVTVSFTTDANAYGRISTTNQTWDVMTSAKAVDNGNGTQSLSSVVTAQACGQTIHAYIAASTEAGDNGAESATTDVTIVIGAEDTPLPDTVTTLHNDASGDIGITIYNDATGAIGVTLH